MMRGPEKSEEWLDRALERLTAPVVAVLLVVATLGPALSSLHTHFLGLEYVDHYGTQWFYWYAEQTLLASEGISRTNLFFFPWGKDLYGHTGANLLDAWLAVPFRAALGAILGYNVFLVAGIAAGAWAFHRFASDLTDDRLAVGVGTALFAVTPYVLFEAVEGRPTQALLVLPVLFLHHAWRSGIRPGRRDPLLAGALLAACGYQYWYYAWFGGLACLGYGLWRMAAPPIGAGTRLEVLGRHALIAAVAGALTLPFALPLLLSDPSEVPGLLDVSKWSLRSSPPVTVEEMTVSIFSWQPLRRDVGALVQDDNGVERYLTRIPWVPLVALPLIFSWLRSPGRLDRGGVIAAVALPAIVATGPVVLIGNLALPNPVEIAMTVAIPFMQRLWWPARAFAFLCIPLGLVLTVGIASARAYGVRSQAALAAAAGLLWVVELRTANLAPFPTWDGAIPKGYACLAGGPEGALIELPYGWTQGHLYFQSAHGRPILGGMIENNPVFTPPEQANLRSTNSYVRSLLEVALLESQDEPEWTEAHREEVYALGYRYVVLQKDALFVRGTRDSLVDNAVRARLRRATRALEQMAGRPVYEDARVAIYAPWGDPSPCADQDLPRDELRVGRTDVSTEDLYRAPPDSQEIWRLLAPLDDGAAADTDSFDPVTFSPGPALPADVVGAQTGDGALRVR